jgi:DNA-directed RNA polymerase II subunit RPB2
MDDWKILDLYFSNHKNPFVSHHLDSYRELIKTYIPNTIKSYNPITMIKYDDDNNQIMKVDLFIGGENSDEIFIDRPITFDNGVPKLITPHDSRMNNLSYETHIYTNVIINITNENKDIITKKFNNICIGSIPIMLHSEASCLLNGQGSKVLNKLNECIYDTGGYFIIDGKEKVIIAQERITNNKLFVSKIKDDINFSYKGLVRCNGEVGETVLAPRTVEFYLVKNPDITVEDDVIEDFRSIKGCIVCRLPSIEGKIPLFILFRALGVESDKDIYELIFGNDNNKVETTHFQNFIRPSVLNNGYYNEDKYNHIYTQEDALNYLKFRVKYKTIDHVKYILTADIFPNISLFENKGKYLGYLIKQMINVILNINNVSDRDAYIYKRVDTSGFLLAELFQETYATLRKSIRNEMDRMYYFGSWKNNKDYTNFINNDNIYKLIKNVLMAETFTKSLKGRWGMSDSTDPELGRVQDLSRISYIGFLSHLRRVNMPIDRTIKIVSPHKLHPQQFGMFCPHETPDGASIGYLKNLAFLTKISAGTNPNNIRLCLNSIGVIPIENYNNTLSRDITKVFINNTWYGITGDPVKILRILKAYRRNSLINILTSISWNIKYNEIRIFTEAGRCCRPLIIVDNTEIKVFKNKYENWFNMITSSIISVEKNEDIYYKNEFTDPFKLELFKKKDIDQILIELEKNGAVIEYLDCEETDTCYIAMEQKDVNGYHTHLEIHPSTILGVVTGNIPLCNHNAAARNIFHAAQTKQAIGIYATNFNKRFDTFGFIQHYPQRPIINTRHAQYTGSDYMPNGFNTVVAIMTYTGFNQEDSIMINKKSIERGLFHLSYFKSISATSKIISQYERTIFANPLFLRDKKNIKINNIKHADYNLIDDNGFVKKGSYVPQGQVAVVIGMVSIRDVYKEVKRGVFMEQVKETIYTDCSITTDDSYFGIINDVYVSNKSVGEDTKICKVKFLKIKKPEFGDKHASRHGQKGVIGMVIPEENMPFTKDGVKPDIIINPHAIPSRMTIGHLVECVYSKCCCIEGILGDGTIYIPLDNSKIYNTLEKNNFDSHGNEILYNGFTGQQIKTEIFIGPTYYFRLKHMVAEKINARGYGPKVLLTRQPTGGRRKAGGLRIGEMERDSVLSHGVSQFMKESMMERSDKFRWCICKRCGTLPIYSTNIKSNICNNCNNNELAVIETPYSFKLLVQELESMSLQLRLNTDYTNLPIEELKEEEIEEFKEDTKVKEIKEIKEVKKVKEDINDDDDKVFNPKTKRYISKKGALAKKLGLVGGTYFYNNKIFKIEGGDGTDNESESEESESDENESYKKEGGNGTDNKSEDSESESESESEDSESESYKSESDKKEGVKEEEKEGGYVNPLIDNTIASEIIAEEIINKEQDYKEEIKTIII